MISRTSTHTLAALLLVLTASWGLAGCDQSGMNESEGTTFTASLNALNSSGVSGEATVTVQNGQVQVAVQAQGTAAEKVHAQHIHGFADNASSCPGMSADSDGNGRISVGEGAPAYGGILVPLDGSLDEAEGLGDLETFPTADASGTYDYRASISTDNLAVNEDRSFEALSLSTHAIVVHGMTVDGEYNATLPVACGTLTRTN